MGVILGGKFSQLLSIQSFIICIPPCDGSESESGCSYYSLSLLRLPQLFPLETDGDNRYPPQSKPLIPMFDPHITNITFILNQTPPELPPLVRDFLRSYQNLQTRALSISDRTITHQWSIARINHYLDSVSHSVRPGRNDRNNYCRNYNAAAVKRCI